MHQIITAPSLFSKSGMQSHMALSDNLRIIFDSPHHPSPSLSHHKNIMLIHKVIYTEYKMYCTTCHRKPSGLRHPINNHSRKE